MIVHARDEASTKTFGRRLARWAEAGDLILLKGEVGMGKTTMARAFVRERAGEEIDVPSPTFALVESYSFDVPLHHVDLYRLDGADQIIELGLDDLYDDGIVLIEWPERAEGGLPRYGLEVAINEAEGGGRTITLTARDASTEKRLASWRGEAQV